MRWAYCCMTSERKEIHRPFFSRSWGKPNRFLPSLGLRWVFSLAVCECTEVSRGRRDLERWRGGSLTLCPPGPPCLDGHIGPWVSRERAFWEKPFLPNTLRWAQKSSLLCVCLRGGLAAHFSSVRAISALSRRHTKPRLIKVHRDIHVQLHPN